MFVCVCERVIKMYCFVYRFSSFNLLFYFGTSIPPDTYTLGSLQKISPSHN